MIDGPKIKGNPLRISVYSLAISYFIGEFVLPKYHLIYFIMVREENTALG